MEIIFANKRVEDFFDSIDKDMELNALEGFEMLSSYAFELRMPYSKPIGGGLFELRIIGIKHIRFLYTFHAGKICILHGFYKKTDKISQQDLEYARNQLKMLN